jgi:hypothetical protein
MTVALFVIGTLLLGIVGGGMLMVDKVRLL